MTASDGICSAEATGPEFNPLTERNKYGQLNPFQDPSRGRIESCTLEQDPNNADIRGCGIGKTVADGQEYLLQNVWDLMGRSITVFVVGAGGVESSLGCCTIGRDEVPEHYSQPHFH